MLDFEPREARALALSRAFLEWAGQLPAGVWAAPGRLNLIGEHTDYSEGYVLPFGIDRYAYVAARPRSDGQLRLWSLQLGQLELPLGGVRSGKLEGWGAYVAGALWMAADAGAGFSGMDLLLDSDVPLGAGLSSSAAVTCASVLAAADIAGLRGDRVELALLARRAEVEVAGVPCGVMDQLASMCAEPERALLIDCRSIDVKPVAMKLAPAGLSLLVIDTKAPHRLVDGEYAERRRSCEDAARALGVRALRDVSPSALEDARTLLAPQLFGRARHVVNENARVLAAVQALGAGRFAELGTLISASHASLRDDFEVSVPELDVAQTSAEHAGALGARLVGGGFGGSVLALVESGHQQAVADAVSAAFAEHGFASPECFCPSSSRGAHRVL
jgi:galactokinase